ncbi:Uma2 family endonuclease [Kineococcus arenarius]|uniref:Uma2 family endonuclease n=1 Tax=unclassified Kineococcus TaxID=2621656 RepID=UPI003D7D6AB0
MSAQTHAGARDVPTSWDEHVALGEDVRGEDVDVSANRYTGRPRLIVEVLSSHATDDTIREVHQYALHGLPHCWILGQYERTLWTYELTGSTFRQTAEITDRGTPPGWDVEVAVDEVLLRWARGRERTRPPVALRSSRIAARRLSGRRAARPHRCGRP